MNEAPPVMMSGVSQVHDDGGTQLRDPVSISEASQSPHTTLSYLGWLATTVARSTWYQFVWGTGDRKTLTWSHPATGPVHAVRFELPDRGILNLEGVACRPLPPPTEAMSEPRVLLEASSVYRSALQDRAVVDYLASLAEAWIAEGDSPPASLLHTELEDRPWVELRFARPVPIESLVIANRRDEWGVRSARMIVSAVQADGEPHQLVDLGHQLDLLRAVTAPEMYWDRRASLHANRAYWADLWELLTSGKATQNAGWDSLLRRLRLSPDRESDMASIGLLNDKLLRATRLQLGQHGMKRPFSFRSASDISQEVAGAADLTRRLGECGYDACLGFGTALGYARGRAVIPHDDDIDVLAAHRDCTCRDRAACMEHMASVLQPLGYSVLGDHTGHRWVIKSNAYDVFVGMADEAGRVDFQLGAKHLRHPRDMLFPPVNLEFADGVVGPFPRNIGAYVQDVYGSQWRLPDPGFVH